MEQDSTNNEEADYSQKLEGVIIDDGLSLKSKCDLAAAKVGGKILFATDDGFAVAENLLKETEAEWREGVYTEYGKWMDGWETRRKRTAGHDWCIIKLGMAGRIHGFEVDTSYFVGNFPPQCSIQAGYISPEQEGNLPERGIMGSGADADQMALVNALNSESWEELLPISLLKPGRHETCHNYFNSINNKDRFTHVRLNLFPDGGVARFRVYGEPHFDWDQHSSSEIIDLAALENGGSCVSYSDAHFGNPKNLLNPGPGLGMFDGWETARRLDRPPILENDSEGNLKVTGKEWAGIRLGHAGTITAIEVNTSHFKGNPPDFCYVEGCLAQAGEEEKLLKMEGEPWKTILSRQKLQSHKSHYFSGSDEIQCQQETINLVRFVIAPDGGVSRLRIWGNARF